MIMARQLRQLQNSGMFHVQQFIVTSIELEDKEDEKQGEVSN